MKRDVVVRARQVKLIALDVDGVMSDGQMIVGDDGAQVKSFDVRDGLGIVLARKNGLRAAIITAEVSATVAHRAKRLGIDWVRQASKNKAVSLEECRRFFKLKASEICYVGDDLPDLPALRRVGLAVSVAGAPLEVRSRVHYVTKALPGRGAVREVVELVLKAQGRWKKIVREYLKK